MYQRLNNFLEETNCFYNLQFGFRLNLSTNNALLSIIENIQTDLDNGDFAAGVLIDLKKVFDKVSHDILLKKLNSMVWEGYRGTGFSPTEKTESNSYQLVIPLLTQKKLPPLFHKDLC